MPVFFFLKIKTDILPFILLLIFNLLLHFQCKYYYFQKRLVDKTYSELRFVGCQNYAYNNTLNRSIANILNLITSKNTDNNIDIVSFIK